MSSAAMRRGRGTEWTLRWVMLGIVVGAALGFAYATSGFNPSRGAPLDVGTALILMACPVLGAVLGYMLAQVGRGPER